jgi:N-methylhydantoinase A
MMIENGGSAASGAVANKKTNRVNTLPKVAVQQKAVVPPTPIYKLGMAIGNTFTDFVLLNTANGNLYFDKILTTYPDPIEGLLEGMRVLLERHKVLPSHIRTIIHGTTAINKALLEQNGAKTGLITTQDFKNRLEIGRDLEAISNIITKSFVPIDLCFGISEPLNINELASMIQDFSVQNGISIGVCLPNALEQKIADFLKRRFPDIYVSLSSEITPDISIDERAAATVMNAYLQPIAHHYWNELEKKLESIGFKGIIHTINAAGRLTMLENARKMPIQSLASGFAGSAMMGVSVCKILKISNALTLDMGGTTAEAALIRKNAPVWTNGFEKKGTHLPVRMPVIDRIVMGAGGHAIAQVGADGLLVVGLETADASIGAACYGRGGTEPTVTDADLVLGFLNENHFLLLHKNLSIKVLDEKIAQPLGISVAEAAWEIHQMAAQNRANAIQMDLMERHLESPSFSVIALGGAGAVQAFALARLLRTPQLVIPVGAGVASALGFLVAPMGLESIWTDVRRISTVDWAKVTLFLRQATQKGYDFLKKAGVSATQAILQRFVTMRYAGQELEITVLLPNDINLIPTLITSIERHFDTEYKAQYGTLMPEIEREIVTWRVVVNTSTPILPLKQVVHPAQTRHLTENRALKGHRPVYLGTHFIECPVYDRAALRVGEPFSSPALIEEAETTVVVGENATIHLDSFGNIIVDLHY